MTDPQETLLAGHPRYQQLRYLSRGPLGLIVLAKDSLTGNLVTVKLIERDEYTHNIEREIINHSGLSHPHVVHFLEVFLSSRYVAIVTDYCAGGNLWQYVADQCAFLGQDLSLDSVLDLIQAFA